MEERILVPVDGSEPSWKALDHALDHHKAGEIIVLHVIDPMQGDYYEGEEHDRPVRRSDEIIETARERFEETAETLEASTEVVTGKPSGVILDFAEENDVDHIVMGSRGRSGLSRLLLGSVAETVVRRSSSPVTIVR